MDQDRVDRIRASLHRAKLDALLLRLPENIVMSFGVWPMNGFSYAVFTADEGPVALIAPSCEDEEMGDCWADVHFFTWPRLAMSDPLQAIRGAIGEVCAASQARTCADRLRRLVRVRRSVAQRRRGDRPLRKLERAAQVARAFRSLARRDVVAPRVAGHEDRSGDRPACESHSASPASDWRSSTSRSSPE